MNELSLLPPQNSFTEFYRLCKERKWDIVLFKKEEASALINALGQSILMACIVEKDKALFKELVYYGIGLHTLDNELNLPLHYAAKIGSLTFVKKLSQHNKVNKENKWNQTPLHIAAMEGHAKVVENLLAYPNFLTLEALWDFGGHFLKVTPLALAVIGGHIPCIDLLLGKESLLSHYRVPLIGSLVHTAIFFHQNHVLEHLLNTYGALFSPQLNEPNIHGQTPLMLAACLGNLEAISFLSKKEVKLDLQDGRGNSSMHWAVMGNQGNAVSLLIQLGAALRTLNQNDLEPFSLAESLFQHHGDEMRSIAALLSNTSHLQEIGLNYIDYPPENLVCQGGGAKGGALVGATMELEDGWLKFLKRVGGTSAGSIHLGLFAIGYKSKEIESILNEINLMDLLDVDLVEVNLENTIQALTALVNALYGSLEAKVHILKSCIQKIWQTTGICKGELFRNIIEKYIKEKTNTHLFTFKDLREGIREDKPYKHFYAFATKINGQVEILDMNSEGGEFDDVPLSDAIFGSMCIPGAFKPFRIHKRSKDGIRIPTEHVVVDGGLLNNCPVERFDRKKYTTTNFTKEDQNFPVFNKRTIAISFKESVDTSFPKPVYQGVNTLKDFLKGMFNIFSGAESLIRKLNPYNECRLIRINPCGITMLDFDMTLEQKAMLIQAGKLAVQEFKREQCLRFHRLLQTGSISERFVPIQKVGTVPGVYIYHKKWIFCVVPFGEITHLNEYLAKHPLFQNFDAPFLRIAFCGCQGTVTITTSQEGSILKNIPMNRGKAQIFEILSWNHLKFEIKEK